MREVICNQPPCPNKRESIIEGVGFFQGIGKAVIFFCLFQVTTLFVLESACATPEDWQQMNGFWIKTVDGVEHELSLVADGNHTVVATVYGAADDCGEHWAISDLGNFSHIHMKSDWGCKAICQTHGGAVHQISAADVERYWGVPDPNNNNVVASGRYAGYTKSAAESLNSNCHGYSLEYMGSETIIQGDGADQIIGSDYATSDLANVTVLKGGDHSAVASAHQPPPPEVGPNYWIEDTSEKNKCSGYYSHTWNGAPPPLGGPTAACSGQFKFVGGD